MSSIGIAGKILTYGEISEDIYCNVCDEQIDDDCLAISTWAYICKKCIKDTTEELEG